MTLRDSRHWSGIDGLVAPSYGTSDRNRLRYTDEEGQLGSETHRPHGEPTGRMERGVASGNYGRISV